MVTDVEDDETADAMEFAAMWALEWFHAIQCETYRDVPRYAVAHLQLVQHLHVPLVNSPINMTGERVLDKGSADLRAMPGKVTLAS